MTLINGEFELRGFRFGTLRSGYPLVPGGFQVEAPEIRVQDEDNPLGDGEFFGEDLLGGVTYSFDMVSVYDGPDRWEEASASVSALRRVWHGNRDAMRRPDQVESLRMYYGDGVGLVYGRPRRFADDRARLRKGIASILCDFRAIDDLVYSDVEQHTNVPILSEGGGGLQAPLEAPLTASGVSTPRAGYITIGGEAATYLRFRFNGPVTNPWVRILGLGWTLRLNISLAADQYVVIDPRPWARTALRYPGGVSVAGRVAATSPPMPLMRVKPGDYELEYGGSDVTSLSSLDVYWRTARFAL